ncbi:hypothetical protein PVAP13_9NG082773 [Panicum virgatum]|uniref:Uncharacterized protein n=1 Tax=Panicum virgatum TaxID=38727 RepID=A0A8T0MC36_PANVG|nr:hypothetical protein PVAP13_9NG082773 [Panicum virgatum]
MENQGRTYCHTDSCLLEKKYILQFDIFMRKVGIYTCSQALKPKRCGKAKENLRKVVV